MTFILLNHNITQGCSW